jgi:hypothetical protein
MANKCSVYLYKKPSKMNYFNGGFVLAVLK